MWIDAYLFRVVNDLAGQYGLLDTFIIFCARFLPYLVAIWMLWFLWAKRAEFYNVFVHLILPALVSRLVFVQIIKDLAARPRPFLDLQGVHLLTKASGYSFPSGHAALFFALALSFYYYDKSLGKWLFIVAILTSLGRVAVGVHYPLDILAGAVLGLLVSYLMNKWFNRKKAYVS